ncbi:hypothetical protein ARMSODRAFT_977386 [Armillaria solidipes]|uniref:Uncharacterized protein n=1 Tax=Armillaria solidipes TaxID=1076256 RepID=A0A2H3BD58_9AGAR|nr:hypothetical protein ARMSODRAFT_977386 [Armillaria solidipes]
MSSDFNALQMSFTALALLAVHHKSERVGTRRPPEERGGELRLHVLVQIKKQPGEGGTPQSRGLAFDSSSGQNMISEEARTNVTKIVLGSLDSLVWNAYLGIRFIGGSSTPERYFEANELRRHFAGIGKHTPRLSKLHYAYPSYGRIRSVTVDAVCVTNLDRQRSGSIQAFYYIHSQWFVTIAHLRYNANLELTVVVDTIY